jgi:hypothetical protein
MVPALFETISAVIRKSPADSDGNFSVTSRSTSETEYEFAGMGQAHGRPYFSKYFGQASAQSVQILL